MIRRPPYRFSGGRQFYTPPDGGSRSLYSTPILGNLLLETPITPADMHQPTLLMEDGGALGQES